MWQWLQTHAEGALQHGSAAIHPAPSSLCQEMSTCAMHLSTSYYLTYTWNEKLHSTWKDIIKSRRPSEMEKPVGGIFGHIFPDTDQLHHLIGLDSSCHLLGQKKCSSKSFNTTALQDRTSEYPSFQNWCVYRFLYSPAPHGAHFETLLVGKETRNIPCMKLQSTNQYVSINEPGFHTLCCLDSAGKQFSIKANWSNALYFLFKQ